MKFVKANWLPLTLMGVALALIALGVGREETEQVFRKAINICMECIGLG